MTADRTPSAGEPDAPSDEQWLVAKLISAIAQNHATGSAAAGALGGVSSRAVVDAARKHLHDRRLRASLFPADLFAEPAWDILLDLFIAEHEHKQIAVKSACIAAGVPMTTALRWITKLEKRGLIERRRSPFDARSSHVALTPAAKDAMRAWLEATLSA